MKVILPLLLAGSAMARPQNFDLDLSLGGSSAVAADEPFDANPSYTYSYQVAADEEQTYIAHQEARDNSVVTGEYSYVDPLGTLITVRYTADADGYREERTEQANFVQIRSRPVVAQTVAAEPVKTIVQQAKPIIQQTVAKAPAGSSDSDLVAKIIAQLTPFIKTTVSSSLGGSGAAAAPAPAPVRARVQAVAARPAAVAVAAAPVQDAVAATFGTGGNNNVVFETPDFNFAYDLEK